MWSILLPLEMKMESFNIFLPILLKSFQESQSTQTWSNLNVESDDFTCVPCLVFNVCVAIQILVHLRSLIVSSCTCYSAVAAWQQRHYTSEEYLRSFLLSGLISRSTFDSNSAVGYSRRSTAVSVLGQLTN